MTDLRRHPLCHDVRNAAGGRRRALALALALAVPTSPVAAAGAAFERPVATARVPAKEGAEFVCTGYDDLGVVEKQDGPTSTDAVLVAPAPKGCGPVAAGKGRTLPTAGMALLGRLGPVLVFSAMDPQGAIDFAVIRAADGQVLVREAAIGDPMFRGGQVRRDGSVVLKYVRAVNLTCSLLAGAKRCWAQMVHAGTVPREMALVVPTAAACGKAYAASGAGRDIPSVASWSQELSIDPGGVITRRIADKIGCEPLP